MDGQRILRSWKEIEQYTGLKKTDILKQGYPVRHMEKGAGVFAIAGELLSHAMRELGPSGREGKHE